MKKIIINIAILLGISFAASAQTTTSALPFTQIDHNPVTTALAGAGSLNSSAYSAFTNASGILYGENKLDSGVSYQLWAPSKLGTSYVTAGVLYKVSKAFGLSVGFSEGLLKPYDIIGYDGLASGKYSPKQTHVAVGLAAGLGESLSLGINANYALENAAEDLSNFGLSGDVYLSAKILDNLIFSAGVSTLGTKIESASKQTFSQPASVKFAGLWNMDIKDGKIDVFADGAYFLAGGVSVAAGAQYTWNDMVYGRIGYNFANGETPVPSFLGIGTGVKFAGFSLDLSYITASPNIGNTVTVGLGFSI